MKKKVRFQGREYIIEQLDNGDIIVNKERFSPFVSHSIGNLYKVKVSNHHFTIEFKNQKIYVDGEEVSVEVKPHIPIVSRKMSEREHRTVKIEAPIPGKIDQILVKKGDKITKDQELIILEAMKMRNRILATQSGEISDIKVKEGEMVKQDQILVIIEG